MYCQSSFYDYLVQCPEGINVNLLADAGPYAALQWQITDKFNNQYTGEVITNGNGGFTIPVSDLPAGLLTSYAGQFELKVLDVDNNCRPVPILVAGYYEAITFDVRRGTRVKDNLGCLVVCSDVDPTGESETFTGDGAETTFTMVGLPVPGQEEVHVGGILYSPNDYTITGHDLIFDTAPADGLEIRIDY